ncbi:MAG: prephenate/arogenate dehydrogenase family protein [Rhodospirillales bacterium]|nr:prephenate/arogenate dehydrogenase family protein [Rhodospirillales bacterium]MCW9039566.1 prephenate/arogenate dehydrogenase family protein [Rhodospirillales bacterium]
MNPNTDAPLFEKVTLIGIGLIGSSMARSMRGKGLAAHIAVCTKSASSLEKARELGLGDSFTHDPVEAVAGADLVVLCTPLGAYEKIAQKIGPALKPGAIVSDVGSVKQQAIEDILPHLTAGVHLVPGHPVAGTEHSGPEAGYAELFEGHWCILTPTVETDAGATEKVSELWRRMGSTVEVMDARHHDKVLAITSHLPHLIAYTIVGTATDLEDHMKGEVIKFSAGGFRDFTRIAASNPEMWRDVFLENKEAVLEMLQRFSEDLTALQRAIRWDEGETLFKMFERTRGIRRKVIEARQDKPDVKPEDAS